MIVVFACGAHVSAQTCSQKVYEKIRKATVFIEVEKVTSANGAVEGNTGTGFIISPTGFVLTNYHVIELTPTQNRVKIKARIETRKSPLQYDLVEVAHDEPSDTALLKIDAPAQYPFVLIGDPNQIGLGQPVCSGGFPKTEDYHPATGSMGSWYGTFLTTDMDSDVGESGAPVFGLAGQVVGIRVAGFDGSRKRTLIVPINLASGLLARVNDHKDACYFVSTPAPGIPPYKFKMSLDDAPLEEVNNDPYAFACGNGWHTANFEFDWQPTQPGPQNVQFCKTNALTTPNNSYRVIVSSTAPGPFGPPQITSCTLIPK